MEQRIDTESRFELVPHVAALSWALPSGVRAHCRVRSGDVMAGFSYKAVLSISECHSLRTASAVRADSMLREPPVQRDAAPVRSKEDSGVTNRARSLE
jgi:hypothetical protein